MRERIQHRHIHTKRYERGEGDGLLTTHKVHILVARTALPYTNTQKREILLYAFFSRKRDIKESKTIVKRKTNKIAKIDELLTCTTRNDGAHQD